MQNLQLTFDCMYCSQGEDFTKFCGLLRIYVRTLQKDEVQQIIDVEFSQILVV